MNGTMKKLIVGLVLGSMVSASAWAATSGAVSTDRFGYTGVIKRYATLADAQAGVNSIAETAVGNRDLGVFVVNDYADYYSDNTIITNSWWYTTHENTNGYPKDHSDGDRLYSGWGNTRGNSGVGFAQLYDQDSSTRSSLDMQFKNHDGNYWKEFELNVSGGGADYANDYARLWVEYQGGGSDVVIYHSYNLTLTAGGLEGTETSPGVIEAFNHPTAVSGTYSGVFENVSTTYPQNNGFYTFDFVLDMDNWAFAQGDEALNGNFDTSYFATVPEPMTMSLLGLGGLVLARRKKA